jgi:thiol:disulfide interchange protein
MRIKSFAFALFVLVSLTSVAQTTGMTFEHNTTWAAIKEKAKKENKYIFMDAFTTWCGPCKMMAAKIFPLPEVGAFFNASYINVKVTMRLKAGTRMRTISW